MERFYTSTLQNKPKYAWQEGTDCSIEDIVQQRNARRCDEDPDEDKGTTNSSGRPHYVTKRKLLDRVSRVRIKEIARRPEKSGGEAWLGAALDQYEVDQTMRAKEFPVPEIFVRNPRLANNTRDHEKHGVRFGLAPRWNCAASIRTPGDLPPEKQAAVYAEYTNSRWLDKNPTTPGIQHWSQTSKCKYTGTKERSYWSLDCSGCACASLQLVTENAALHFPLRRYLTRCMLFSVQI